MKFRAEIIFYFHLEHFLFNINEVKVLIEPGAIDCYSNRESKKMRRENSLKISQPRLSFAAKPIYHDAISKI